MTHNEKRTEWWKEGLAALISGSLYGVSNSLVGHPLDTVKTKMQVVPEYKNFSMLNSMKHLLKTEGLVGFFRGVFPPMCGGSLFRSTQFAVFEALYTKLQNNRAFTTPIPFTFGLEPRTILAGIAAGTGRAIIECPFEYSKVQRQTGQVWKMDKVYQGFNVVWIRACGMLTTYFVMVDTFRRNTNAYKHPYGIFFMNGLCAMIGFIAIWPFEITKNEIQSMSKVDNKVSVFGVMKSRVKNEGVYQAFFRGSLPGLSSVYIRNGTAMLVMLYTQRMLTYYGFRD